MLYMLQIPKLWQYFVMCDRSNREVHNGYQENRNYLFFKYDIMFVFYYMHNNNVLIKIE